MRYIFSGAEKVREATRKLYAERFGVRVLEGYGATETAPVLALNTPMHCRPGSAGRLLPGVSYRFDRVEGIARGGRLLVRGPNVMLGDLRGTAPGVLETLPDGWYDTGDICEVDTDGFVWLIARARRFAKIAGEMVSMPSAEALATALWPDAAHAVVAIPDGRKGEALVLLTTQPGAASQGLLACARERGIAEIAVPRIVRVVPALPLLGSGKIDYGAATRLAAEERAAA
jgi:acyl-[acyl-carrier-protein]-phospholipid O-acyltransferase/long-chain-fatty-acid--[acyl-carrier-protein] ligase